MPVKNKKGRPKIELEKKYRETIEKMEEMAT
jgi:hypothetical protein